MKMLKDSECEGRGMSLMESTDRKERPGQGLLEA